MQYSYFTTNSFKEVLKDPGLQLVPKQEIMLSMLRINILSSIQNAGSGHLGSSLSAVDIMLTALMFLDKFDGEKTHFFSSKGHDAPALYACYEALGKFKNFTIKRLRRIDGPSGHPDVKIPNVQFNTGSLGMGISKANGWISGGNYLNEKSKIVLVIGDGEFQEGQNFEALMYLQNNPNINPLIIMDSNKIQSDTWVEKVKSYASLQKKVESFGIRFKEIDGHNILELNRVYKDHFSVTNNSPTFICANTIKSKGIKFAEGSNFSKDLELYPHHAGAMAQDDFMLANQILFQNYRDLCSNNGFHHSMEPEMYESAKSESLKSEPFNILETYKKYSVKFFTNNLQNIALDADLLKDAGSLEISRQAPEQFFEFGIAEQDMVSFAAGISARGLVPWSHSFSCFLTTRAQEQIFNFCSEKRKGLFIGALAGPIPGGPGHSHQMLRDLALMGSMPYMNVFEPISQQMMEDFFEYQSNIDTSIFVRMANCQLYLNDLNSLHIPEIGNLAELIPMRKETKKVVIIQGAILLSELSSIMDDLKEDKDISVYAAVWLNKISYDFLKMLKDKKIYVFQTTVELGSFASQLSARLLKENIKVTSFYEKGINNIPECGSDSEVLEYHGLDSKSLMEDIYS